MWCKSFSLVTILGIILMRLMIPRNGVISSSRSKEKCYEGRFTREINNFEQIVPHRANSDGTFLSYSLPQFYERAISREKRVAPPGEPKVHYVLTIKGVAHHVELWPSHGIMSPNLVVERRSPNISEVVAKLVPDRQCHYVGRVRGHTDSRATLSVCDGMAGYVRVRRDIYYIEPEKASKPEDDGQHLHLVYRATDHDVNSSYLAPTSSNCGTGEDWEKDWGDRLHWEVQNDPHFFNNSVNRRNESKHYYIETCLIVDNKFITFHHEKDIENYLLTIFNMVASLFHDSTVGNYIDVILTRIIYLEKEVKEIDLEISCDANKTLRSFCAWAERLKPNNKDHPHHYDIAILVTRYDICSNATQNCNIIGLAHTAQACRRNRGCSINEDVGLITGNSIAHELGHLLGCSHDIPEQNGCNPQAEDGSFTVMAPFTVLDINSWSQCSRIYMSKFFDKGLGDCLLNKPVESNFIIPDMPPGALYDAKYQCEERFGKEAKVCPIVGDRMCKSLYCLVGENRCLSTGNAPADGTKCGEDMWCFNTECVMAGKRPEAIDGKWSKWGSWSECSRTCGGGIKVQQRECDNPKPQHRGRYCMGPRIQYQMCNVGPCDFGVPTFREVQCSRLNGQWGGEKWKPSFLKARDANPCELRCVSENNVEISDKRVEDGTRCRPGTKDTCISGLCRKVGCDWKLDSDAIEDECGICSGNGLRCKLVEGNYSNPNGTGYQKVMTIPARSTNINILEVNSSKNLIAVTNSKGKYLLNGDMKEQPDGEYLFGVNVIGVYTHVEPNKGELMIKGPTTQVLIIEQLLRESNKSGITYSFFMRRNTKVSYIPKYEWDFIELGTCSAKCGGGTQISKPSCVEVHHGHVNDIYCDLKSKPDPLIRACNLRKCKYRWKAGPWGPCDSGGRFKDSKQRRAVYCVKENPNPVGEYIIADSCHCRGLRPRESQTCLKCPTRICPRESTTHSERRESTTHSKRRTERTKKWRQGKRTTVRIPTSS